MPALWLLLILVPGVAWTHPPQSVESILHLYALDDEDVPRMGLPGRLSEISGLTFDADGRLFAHHDEAAHIFQLDPSNGEVLSQFSLGRGIRGDFEGIASVGDRLFLVDSRGWLTESSVGRDGERVSYRALPTGLGERCEAEGLAFDPASGNLLLPCKTPRDKELRGHLVVFAFSLETLSLLPEPRFFIPLESLEEVGLGDEFNPSAIVVHPMSGTILVASARQNAVVEIHPGGRLLAGQKVARRRLRQLEGIAVGPDGSLYLASEGGLGRPRLARFEPSEALTGENR